MNIQRIYKLYKLGITIKPIEKEIFQFLELKFYNLKEVRLSKYPRSIFYFNKDQCMFQIQYKDFLYFTYEELWDILKKDYKYSIGDNGLKELKNIMRFWIETKYKLKINSIQSFSKDVFTIIEKEYKKYK